MYEIRCIVSDKKLADFLRAVRLLTMEKPGIEPMDDDPIYGSPRFEDNAKPVKNKKKGTPRKNKRHSPPGKGALSVVEDLIQGRTTITVKEASAAVQQHGYSSTSYTHPIKLLLARGVLSPVSKGIYNVLKAAA